MNDVLPVTNFDNVEIYKFGNSIQITGLIWSGNNEIFITQLPNKLPEDFTKLSLMPLDLVQWQKLLRQTDLLETEMFAQDATGITKSIVRKTQRQMDTRMQWAVYARDEYTCRYCGRTNSYRNPLPLTVDHIILWEKKGVTVIENLITACRQCNSDRGNTEYDVWIESDAYKKRSINLPESVKKLNLAIVSQLPYLRSLTSKVDRSR